MESTATQPGVSLALVILMVDDPRASAAFYQRVLGVPAAEESPTFAMFALPSGTNLGLWSRTTTAPPVSVAAGASELCFMEDDVDAVHESWVARGIPIAQPPTEMDFGRTFVALDPDGHRLRVFRPAPDETHG
jgi:predicted enzyme related to lactoylglutathione lyase